MSHDIHTLLMWIRGFVIVASIFSTAMPIIYGILFPWRSRPLGKLFMLHGVALAAAIDVTLVFTFWTPKNILIQFWIEIFEFASIGGSTAGITFIMLKIRYSNKRGRRG